RHTPLEGGGLCAIRLGSNIGPPRSDLRDPRLPPQTVRRDLADARGWGEYTAAQNTGHKFFEIGLRGAETLGVGKMNACRLGHRKWGESPPTQLQQIPGHPRKRGPLFMWRNRASPFRGNDLVTG